MLEQQTETQVPNGPAIYRTRKDVDIVQEAITYAMSAINEVWEGDSLAFWQSIDWSDVYCWMQEDVPLLAETIRKRDLEETFHRRFAEHIHLFEDAECIVARMKQSDVDPILASHGHESRLAAVKGYMNETSRSYTDHDKWRYGSGWDNEDDYAEEWKATKKKTVAGYGAFATETVAREILKLIESREPSTLDTNSDEGHHIFETNESCAIVEEMRRSLLSPSTCYVVGNRLLPPSLQDKSRETHYLAVRVADQWLDSPRLLGAADSLQKRFVRMADNKPPVSVFAIGINAVWLEARNGLDVFRRLRREIPILYVGSDKTVLVKHPYNHFFDLSKPWAVDTDTHSYEVTLQQFATPFADGTIVRPTLKTNFVNLSLS